MKYLRSPLRPLVRSMLRSPFEIGGVGLVPSTAVLNHIIVMGQSNGVAGGALPELSTSGSPAYMFGAGTKPGGTGLASLRSLVESPGETIASSMSAWLNAQTGEKYLVSNVALNGAEYNLIKKGTTPYNDALAQVRDAKSIAATYFTGGYKVIAVCLIHGEQDQQANNTSYATNVATLRTDFNTDAKVISGQAQNILMFACQQNGYSPSLASTQPGNGTKGGASAFQLEGAAVSNPGTVHLVAPRYQLPYLANDQLHESNHAERWQGEQYAKAIYAAVYGAGWTGFIAGTPTIVGAVITVPFTVPVAPLVFDYSLVLNPGVGKGFEYWDDSGAIPAITSVALNGTTSVDITLASAPAAFTYRHVRYGHTPTTANRSGMFRGARGCLFDSDATVSRYGYPLSNPCPHFVRTF